MTSYIQLICFFISFYFGILLYYTNKFNILFSNNKPFIIKFIINFLYIFNMSLLYVVVLYKINNGILHVYFVFLIILGYILSCVKKRK
jgi:hypothetical protein